MERMARGDLFPVYIPSLRWRQTINGLNIDMLYPTYRISCCHRTVLFTHGHHLDGIQTFTHAAGREAAQALRRGASACGPGDDDDLCLREHLPLRLHRGDGLLRGSHLESLQPAAEVHVGVFRNQRFASVEGQYDAILKFIRDQNLGKVDCFIYGDTHRAGIFQRKGGPLAVNAGSFTREQGKGSCLETPDTYLFLDEDGLALRQLGRSEPLFLCELL